MLEPPTYTRHHITELRRDHSLRGHELGDEPIILRRRHVLPWPRRQRHQQLLRRPELAA
jgi:hypothetical protein